MKLRLPKTYEIRTKNGERIEGSLSRGVRSKSEFDTSLDLTQIRDLLTFVMRMHEITVKNMKVVREQNGTYVVTCQPTHEDLEGETWTFELESAELNRGKWW